MVKYTKGNLMVCLVMCLTLCMPVTYAASQSWSYRIDGISTSVMTEDGQSVLVGSSSGFYYIFNEYGEILNQEDIGGKISSVDVNEESIILGTEFATFILSVQGRKILHTASDPVISVAISENNSYAISGTETNIFRFASLKNTKQLNVGTPVRYVAISPSGKKAAAATSDAVYFFDNDTDVYNSHEISSTISMQFLGDKSLIVGTKTGSLYSVAGASRNIIGELGKAIVSVEIGNDKILAGTSNNIYIFDNEGIKTTDFTVEELLDCDISFDGKFIVAANSKGLYLFDERGEVLWQKDIDHIKSTEISSDGRYMTVTTSDGIFFFCNWEKTFKGTNYYPYASREQYSFVNFKRVWSYPRSPIDGPYIYQSPTLFDVGDVNGDGINEIVASVGKDLVILDPEGNLLFKKSYSNVVYYIHLMDLNNDTVPEITYALKDGKYRIFVMDAKKREHEEPEEFDFTSSLKASYRKAEDVSIEPVIAYDIDDDGKTEILVVVATGYSPEPRGVLAFEYPSGNWEWFYRSAPNVAIDAFADINKDGRPEIILSSHSSCTGNTEGQRDDCHIYLTLLDLNGEEVWSREIASGFKELRAGVEDINNDGETEIVGAVSDTDNVNGRLFVLDSRGETLYDQEFEYSIWLGGIFDLGNDRSLEIVTTNSEGFLYIYNSKLQAIGTYKVGGYIQSRVKGISDMDGDGSKEIIVMGWDGSAIVLDSNLKEEDKWNKVVDSTIPPIALIANVSGCGNDLLILTKKNLEMYSFEGEGEYLCSKLISPAMMAPTTPPPTTPLPTTPPPSTTPPVTPSPTPTSSTTGPDKEKLSRGEVITIISIIVTIIGIIVSIILIIISIRRKKKRRNPTTVKKYEKSQDKKLIVDTDENNKLQQKINSQIEKLRGDHRVSDMNTIGSLETVKKTLTKVPIDQQERIKIAYQQAIALINGGQYDDAYKILRNLLNDNPSFYIAWIDLGNALSNMKRYEEAYDAYSTFEKYTSDVRELIKSWHNKANILITQGKKKEALELYNKVMKVFPDDFNALIMISQLLIEEEEYDEANANIERILTLDLSYPQKIIAYELELKISEKKGNKEEIEDVISMIEKAREGLRLLSEGLKYAELGHYEKALEDFSKLVDIEPEDFRVHYNKGLALEKMRKFPEALDCYSRSLALNPKIEDTKEAYSRCAYNIGVLLRSKSEPEKALQYFDKALEHYPFFYECLVAKGDALQDIKKYDESISLYDQAIEVQPNFAKAYVAKGYSLIMKNEKSKALLCYETALKLDSLNPVAIRNKSKLLGELGITSDTEKGGKE